MPRSPFRLRSTIGRSYSVEPEDVLRTKKLLKELGYFEIPAYGLTPYPDEPMFKGIEQFQDDFDLYRDGVMNPDGETMAKLDEVLDYRDRTSTPARQDTGKSDSSRLPRDPARQDKEPPTGRAGRKGRKRKSR